MNLFEGLDYDYCNVHFFISFLHIGFSLFEHNIILSFVTLPDETHAMDWTRLLKRSNTNCDKFFNLAQIVFTNVKEESPDIYPDVVASFKEGFDINITDESSFRAKICKITGELP